MMRRGPSELFDEAPVKDLWQTELLLNHIKAKRLLKIQTLLAEDSPEVF